MTNKTTLEGIHLDQWSEYFDEAPFEVIDGEIVPMHPPSLKHVWISQSILFAIYDYLKEHPLGQVWQDNTTYVLESDASGQWIKGSKVPNVSFIMQHRIDAHQALHREEPPAWWLAPDLAVEVVSPNDKHRALMRKVADYLHYGTQQVCGGDPQNRTIRVHTATNPDGTTLHNSDTLRGDPLLPDFALSVATILGKP